MSATSTTTRLTYGEMTAAEVEVEAAFGPQTPFLLGRTAATDPRFPKKLPGTDIGVIIGAACGTGAESVRTRAFAELVEHVSGFAAAFETDGDRPGTWPELSREERTISPASLQHFADWQELPETITRMPEEATLTYTGGVDVVTGETTLVPAQAAFLLWQPPAAEPSFLRACATGLAAGRSREAALRHAILEVLERDLCMLSWRVPGMPVYRVPANLTPDPLAATAAALGLAAEVYWVALSGLPGCVIAVLHDTDDGQLTCGSACGTLDGTTVGRAVGEALMLQWSMRGAGSEIQLEPMNAVPRTSLQHVAGAFNRGRPVAEWFRTQARPEAGPMPPGDLGGDVRALAAAVARHLESPVIEVDLTDKRAREAGWHVCRAIVPGAVPRESDGRVQHLGGPRLAELLHRFAPGTQRPRPDPHPFG